MFMCCTKRSSEINSIYSGQELFSCSMNGAAAGLFLEKTSPDFYILTGTGNKELKTVTLFVYFSGQWLLLRLVDMSV